jgi:hypothetical protein
MRYSCRRPCDVESTSRAASRRLRCCTTAVREIRQGSGKLTGRYRRPRQALEYDHANGVPEQRKYAQGRPKFGGMGMGFSHLSRWANTFGKRGGG